MVDNLSSTLYHSYTHMKQNITDGKNDLYDKIIAYWLSGHSAIETGAKFNKSRQRIYKILEGRVSEEDTKLHRLNYARKAYDSLKLDLFAK